MPGINCIDAPIGKAAPLFSASLAFQNPVLPQIKNVNASISSFLSLPSLDTASAVCLGNLSTLMGTFQDFTHFMSGVTPVFPASVLGSSFLSLPAGVADALGALTFTEMLGALSGGLNAQSAMCQTSPSSPCGLASNVLGVVTGAASPILDGIASGLSSAALITGGICNFVTQTVASLAGLIMTSIASLLNALSLAANYAIGKIVTGLSTHPCFSSFIGAVATPALSAALAL